MKGWLTGCIALLCLLVFYANPVPAAAAAPVMTGATVSGDNAWVTVTFDQGVSSSSWAVFSLDLGDLNVEMYGGNNNPAVGTAVISSYDQMNHVPGGSSLMFHLNYDPQKTAATGQEYIEINVYDYSSVFSLGSPGQAADPNVRVTAYLHDSTAPLLAGITSDASSPGVLKIGDLITFTLTPATTEPGAEVTGSYNGRPLVWTTSDGGAHYTAAYTVTEGDADQASPLQISGVTIADVSGNTSAPGGGSDVARTIDANAPAVAGVSQGQNCTGPVTITFNEGAGELDGGPFTSGSEVSGLGSHTLVVTDSAGNVTAVTFTISPLSSNADLAGLSLSAGSLLPGFDPSITEYSANVGNSVSSLEITAFPADQNVNSITIGGQEAAGGAAVAVSLNAGLNVVPVVVSAQDGTTKTYTLSITRDLSSNADLFSLIISGVDLTPAFHPDIVDYSAGVANGVASLEITAVPADQNFSSLNIGGEAATGGVPVTVSLGAGFNTITVVVSAQDGTAKTYTLAVSRGLSNNASLASLSLAAGELNPAFDPSITEYTATVENVLTSIGVTAIPEDVNVSSITIGGQAASFGVPVTVGLSVGPNIVPVVVAAQDGTVKNYTVTITRQSLITVIFSDNDQDRAYFDGNPFGVDISGLDNIPDGPVRVALGVMTAPGSTDLSRAVLNGMTSAGGYYYLGGNVSGGSLAVAGNISNPGNSTLAPGIICIRLYSSDGSQQYQPDITVQDSQGRKALAGIGIPAGTVTVTPGLETFADLYSTGGPVTFSSGLGGLTGSITFPAGLNIVDSREELGLLQNSFTLLGAIDLMTGNITYQAGVDVSALTFLDSRGATISVEGIPAGMAAEEFTVANPDDPTALASNIALAGETLSFDVNHFSTYTITGSSGGGQEDRSWALVEASTATPTRNVAFSLNITGAKDAAGSDLEGPVHVRVTSSSASEGSGGVVYSAEVAFTAGGAAVPVTLANALPQVLTVDIDGVSSASTVNVAVQPALTAAGSASDPVVTMAEGNTSVSAGNSSWMIDVVLGTVNNNVTGADIALTGLPSGLSAAAAKGTGNTIAVTVSGTAGQAVNGLTAVSIVVRGSAVAEAGAADSAPISVFLSPAPVSGSVVAVTGDQKDVTLDGSTPDATVEVPESVTDARINMVPLVTEAAGVKTATFPAELTIQAVTSVGQIQVEIPANTVISAPASWTGTVNVPSARSNSSVSVTPDSGRTASVSSVIEVGFDDVPLTFSRGVRILIPGQAGKDVGYYRGGSFTKITTAITADTQAAGDSLPAGGDGKIDVGPDLVVWTKHFTRFVSYTQASSGGGGGGGGGVSQSRPEEPGEKITKEGGTVSEPGVTITFPAGAVESDISIRVNGVAPVSGLTLPNNSRLVSQVVDIVKDNSGSFKKPITITMTFEKSKVDSGKYTVSIYWYDESAGRWVQLENVSVDMSSGTVSGSVNHLTKFAVLAAEKTVHPEQKTAVTSTDIDGHWAEANIKALAASGAVSGYPDGTFRPEGKITRAEFAALLVKAFKLQQQGDRVFDDTAGHWASGFISTATALGIAGGYPEGGFGPDNPITREQMAVMTVKAAKLTGTGRELTFADTRDISDWALEGLAIATGRGIMEGYPDHTVNPKGNATRAEAVTIILNALKK